MHQKILLILIFQIPIILFGQYTHRLEVSVSTIASQQYDLNSFEKYGIEYKEDNTRTGAGVNAGIHFVFDFLPISTSIKYTYVKGDRYRYETDITSFDSWQSFNIHSTSFNVYLEPFRNCSFSPYIYCGVNLISMNLYRENIEVLGYMHDDFTIPLIWGYNYVDAQINSFGYIIGTGLKYRISDKAGIYLDVNFKRFSQDDTSWVGEKVSVGSLELGAYFRFLKRKLLKVY